MSNTALVTILSGEVSARQVENEFRLKAGSQSTWRWYAKKVGDKAFQVRFPNPRTIEDLAFFSSFSMGTLPSVTLKVEKWNAATGATGAIDTAWFRIRGIPYEKRSVQNISKVASFVGLPMEVDVDNLTKFDFVKIKIGCRMSGRSL